MKAPQQTVVCFGEVLIDMISLTIGDLVASKGFLKKFGGAPANTAMGLAKLGIPVTFMGKIGDDPFGHFLKETLENYHVDTHSLVVSGNGKTTLAFVSLGNQGQRDFFFYRGAHEAISPDEFSLPNNASILHFGSLTQTNENGRKTTDKLIREAKNMNALVSYDPNIRESLWGSIENARSIILDTREQVDVFKINDEEALTLSKKNNIEDAAEALFTPNLQALFITLGREGSYYKTKNYSGSVSTIKVNPIDTTGAGDAFNAGYIEGILSSAYQLSEIPQTELEQIVRKATIIASLTTTKKGAITAFPTKASINKLIKS